MSVTVKYHDSKLNPVGLALARVGNPLRQEPLQTSRTLCKFKDSEAELLTHCLLRPFGSLEPHRMYHHTDLSQNELFGYASAIFEENASILENGEHIARHLHERSNRPNIKAGDLCIGLIDGLVVEGQSCQGLCIIKSETKVPFLEIAEHDGDLELMAKHGIYPEKIDKGCLIVDHEREEGFLVYLFDQGSTNAMFWIREFVGAVPLEDEDYLTKRYSELCVAFAEQGLPEGTKEEERLEVANRGITYLSEAEDFSLDEFQQVAVGGQGQVESFQAFKNDYEKVRGCELEDRFTPSRAVAERARKKLRGRLKLDTGVELKFTTSFVDQSESLFVRGFDKQRKMNFVKIYYYDEQ